MSEIIYSPLSGTLIPITQVNDDMFAQKMLGDGMAIIPEGSTVVSPVDGTVTMVYETKHCIGIETKHGSELLIHMGIDTVELNGVPFRMTVKQGDKVSRGDTLVSADWKYIQRHGKDPVVPVISLNKPIKVIRQEGAVRIKEPIFEIE